MIPRECDTCGTPPARRWTSPRGNNAPISPRTGQLALAILKCIEIVGEAGAAIALETTTRYPEIPWRQIRGMRNRLIHGYYEIDFDIVWDTVEHNLGPLVAALDRVLPEK